MRLRQDALQHLNVLCVQGRTVPGLTRLLMRPPQPLRAGADEPEECVGVWLLCLAFMTDKMKARAVIYQHSKQLIGVVV
jgi:hypothetical protein